LIHGVSHGLRNSDETPSSQHFQAFCPVLRDHINNKQGSLGPVVFIRVSNKIITNADALKEGGETLETLENHVMQRQPNYPNAPEQSSSVVTL
jgi:hypothetical protein